MKCRRSEELWSDYLEGILPAPLQKDLEDHLHVCPDCPPRLAELREVLHALRSGPRPEAGDRLTERILALTRSRLSELRRAARLSDPASIYPAWTNWVAAAVAASFVLVLVFRPPRSFTGFGDRLSRLGRQAYSFGVRVYTETERLMDELNILRMTVGVAFEDRVDRLNERLKDLEEARQKREDPGNQSSSLGHQSPVPALGPRARKSMEIHYRRSRI
ncbi:MAG: anti-sigma factor family protein [Acidobacteriota bacterium]